MKRIWNQLYRKGLRKPIVSKNAVCKDNQIILNKDDLSYTLIKNPNMVEINLKLML